MPQPSQPSGATRALAVLYGAAVKRRNRAYDEGRKPVARADACVISVGNVSAGGTGKTPFVALLARRCAKRFPAPASVAIVSRGYGRASRGEVVVSDGAEILVSVEEAGDEAFMNAETLLREECRVAVIVNKRKALAAESAARRFGSRAVIVDDGFQHRALWRDCDIVLLDRQSVERPYLLPAGRLREPLSSLRRATVICCAGGLRRAELPAEIAELQALWLETEQRAGVLYPVCGANRGAVRAIAVCGVAKPERFAATLAQAGVEARETLVYADHHPYSQLDAERVIRRAAKQGCGAVVTTEKDAVKLKTYAPLFEAANVMLAALPLRMEITSGEDDFDDYLSNLFSRISRTP